MDHHSHTPTLNPPSANGAATELNLRVDGMTCAGCAAAVQRSIEALPGVTGANVSVTEARATVTGDDLDSHQIVEAIRSSGYDAEPIIELPAPAALRSEIELRQADHERKWKRRAIIGLSVWVPLEALHWIGRAAGWHAAHGALSWMDWVMFIGATVVIVAAGGGFYQSAWQAAKRGNTNMDTLIAMGATVAYVYSLVLFIMKLSGSHTEHPMYFAEAAALLGIISLGHWLEARASARAGSAVRELLELQPDTAEVIEGRRPGTPVLGTQNQHGADSDSVPGTGVPGLYTRSIASADVKPDDRILIRPGGRVPVDGVVLEGESEIDEAVVTGESLPVRKTQGDHVVAGSMNTVGQLIIRATVDGKHTTIARIADMVQRAQTSRANIQRLADYIASIFVPTVLAIALITLVGWTLAGDFPKGVISTVTVLIISCPCALGLATPMAVMVGAGAASKAGVLVKSAMAFETAGRAQFVVFDKTGTLTAGAPELNSIQPLGTLSEDEILRFAAAVEAPSEHPVAKAIVNAARMRQLSIPSVQDFRAIPGEGVRGIVNGKDVSVRKGDEYSAIVEVDGQSLGGLQVSDALRPDAVHAVEQLRNMGLTVYMLSGDRRSVAEHVGSMLGLPGDHVIAEATPQSKVDFVARLASQERAKPQAAAIMVGDGINDAAALAQADLGIALASGTNIAIESADVVIPSDRVAAVAQTIHIARQTLRTIKQNLFFAFFYNSIAIPVAALGLLGTAGPLIAAAAMGLSDITVIGNAIRLKRKLARDISPRRG